MSKSTEEQKRWDAYAKRERKRRLGVANKTSRLQEAILATLVSAITGGVWIAIMSVGSVALGVIMLIISLYLGCGAIDHYRLNARTVDEQLAKEQGEWFEHKVIPIWLTFR